MAFADLGLDPRLLRALNKREFETPTPVQSACIPKALEGRDIVARARTGSGKTLAYLLPAFHRILSSGKGLAGWQALVLVPTRELCEQVAEEAASLATHCGEGLTATALLAEGSAARSTVSTAGQLVVTTPGRVATLIRDGALPAKILENALTSLVLDEADLLLSYGYESDVSVLAPLVPRSCQCMLMSATTSDDVDRLTKLVLQSPESLDLLASSAKNGDDSNNTLHETGGAASEIEHRRIDLPPGCASGGPHQEVNEKLLFLLTLLRLALVPRKVLIFVNSIDTGMRVRLFLDAFGLRCSVLSADLPLNSRHHILQEFNRGLFDYLIATDDVHAADFTAPRDNGKKRGRNNKNDGKNSKKKSFSAKKDEEFGVTRGIDFKGVQTVINFDMPGSVEGYVHRVGRTGRAGQSGTAVSLFAPSEGDFAAELEAALAVKNKKKTSDGDVGLAINVDDSNTDNDDSITNKVIRPYERITPAAVEGLRYRAEDVARSITKNVIKEARAKDLKAELLNNKRLAAFFEERPADLQLLRHDRPIAASAAAGAAAPHLKHLPAYLRDPTLQGKSFVGVNNADRAGYIPQRKRKKTEGVDPVKGFTRAPKKGGDRLEAPTEIEVRAEKAANKERKALKKKGGASAEMVPKRNVRRFKGRKR
jgi:ATP-dependent RNA helicase DDX56/DBP9